VSGLLGRNLRTRLTVLYASLLAAALLLYAGCVSAFFLHNLREPLDSSLDRDLETVEAILYVNPDGQLQLRSHEGEADEDELDRGYLLEVWSDDGRSLYRSEQLGDQPLGPVPKITAGHSRESAKSLQLNSRMRVRTMGRLHHMPNGKAVILRLGISEEPLWRDFWKMVAVLGIGLPIILFLVVIAGYLVAARALRPVDSMAKRAAEITADHLHERLTINNADDELGQLGTAFNATLARLESSFDQLKRFTADASHELRTPLTAIRSVGEVSLRKSGDERYYRDTIGSMLEETNRLTLLVDSLLTMSRADSGQIQANLAAIGLLELAKESAAIVEVLAEEKEQELRVEGDPSVVVKADRTILKQALVNLIDNAVKYSPTKGSILVRVLNSQESAVMEVHDSGPGVPIEHRKRIFERFYRVDKARSRADGGTGLGLSIAQWAVAIHAGTIEVQSEPGRGSIFIIRLPRLMTTTSTVPTH
jgi:heavy metal sensor kinase